MLKSTLPDDPALEGLLVDYFPAPLRERFPAAITGHPLRREIIATALTNRAVNIAGVTGLFRLLQETGVPLARVVLGRTRWPARSSTSTGCGTPSGRWTTRCRRRSRWSCAPRRPGWPSAPRAGCCGCRELADDAGAAIAEVTDRFAAPVAAVRAGLPGWLLGARGDGLRRAGGAAAGGRRARRTWPPRSRRRRCCRPRSTWPSSAERTGAPVALAGQVMQCLAERLGLVPLRELVIALPRDRRWPSMARASLRDDLADGAGVAHRGRADAAPHGRPTGRRTSSSAAWVKGWDTTQARSAAQLADITVGRPARAGRAAGRRPHAARPAPPA